MSPKHIHLQSRWKRCRFWAPSGGVCPRAFLWAKPLFYLRKLMFFLKNINFTKVFHTFGPCLASGAPLGPWAAPWRPFLDLSGRVSGLGSSLGSSLGASVCFLVCFFCFSTAHGIIFSKCSSITLIWHRVVQSNSHLCFPFYLLCGRVSLLETGQAELPGRSIFML